MNGRPNDATIVNLPTNPSESFKRRNPELYGRAVDTNKGEVVQPDERAPLDTHLQGACGAKVGNVGRNSKRSGRPIIRITIVALTRRQIDGDNLGPATKQIRDQLAEHFGIDDSEKFIDWQYASVPSRGRCGVVVTIEPI